MYVKSIIDYIIIIVYNAEYIYVQNAPIMSHINWLLWTILFQHIK